MQSINIVVFNPFFMGALFGTAAISLSVTTISPSFGPRGAALLDAVYLIGTILVTIAFSVPLNNAVAAVKPSTVAGGMVWRRYVSNGRAWNHVRRAASLAASGLFVLSLIARSPPI